MREASVRLKRHRSATDGLRGTDLEQDRGEVLRTLKEGADRAREVASETMAQVRKAMHLP